jgi:RND family efflux transporter MFP subunit
LALGLLALGGCGKGKGATPTPPAKVDKIASEDQLNTLRLTPEAEKRIGLELTPLVREPISRVRNYGGEVMLPPGAAIIVSAPIAGTLLLPPKEPVPKIGGRVAKEQAVFLLLPLVATERAVLSPGERIRYAEARNAIATSRIDAQGQMQQAEVQVEAARIALDRAERLLRDKAGTVRAVDDAQAQMSIAQKGFDAASARKKLLDELEIEDDPQRLAPLAIAAPQAGLLRSLQAAVGEVVAAGAPLFEVMEGNPIWIRVPVYVGELADLAADKPARFWMNLSHDQSGAREAKPVDAPPTATALSSAVDIYFQVANPRNELRPAQRVDVELRLKQQPESLVVPWSAVVHDIQGGSWVYEQIEPQVYVRRRVQVKYVLEGRAVLDAAIKPGAKIVTAGVIELFGTEFGFGK